MVVDLCKIWIYRGCVTTPSHFEIVQDFFFFCSARLILCEENVVFVLLHIFLKCYKLSFLFRKLSKSSGIALAIFISFFNCGSLVTIFGHLLCLSCLYRRHLVSDYLILLMVFFANKNHITYYLQDFQMHQGFINFNLN